MPYINRPKTKENHIPYKHESKDNDKYYKSKYWKRLRESFLLQHPLCELCILEGRTTPTEEIHHRIEFLSGVTDEDRWKLLLDPDNLQALCEYHHHEIHNQRRRAKRMAGVETV